MPLKLWQRISIWCVVLVLLLALLQGCLLRLGVGGQGALLA